MKRKAQFIEGGLALVLISLLSAQGTSAQHSHDHGNKTAGKTGMLRVSKSVWAGDVWLKSGMYHVKHVVDGNTHVLVFKSVNLPGGFKEFNMVEEKEVARLNCQVVPVTRSISNTRMLLGKNAAGELVIREIQIAGEKVKHVLAAHYSVSIEGGDHETRH